MPAIDLTTLIILTLAINLLVAGYMALLAKLQPQQIAFRHWALSCFVFVIASLLAISRYYQVPAVLSELLAHLLLAFAPILVGTGIFRFIHTTSRPLPWGALSFCAVVYLLLLISSDTQSHAVGLISALAIAAGCLWCALLLQPLVQQQPISRVLQAVLVLHAFTMFSKAALYLSYWQTALPAQALALQQAMLVSHLLLTTVAAVLLPLLFFIAREQQLMRQADLDELTLLPNRRHFLRETGNYLAQHNNDAPLTIMMLDLDHFKAINDSFGHAAGDKALQMIASILTQELRKTDFIGRVGGEEFAILIPNSAEEEARCISQRLRKQVELQARVVDGKAMGLTISIGATFLPDATDADLPALLQQADAALYQSKRQGRNTVTFCYAS